MDFPEKIRIVRARLRISQEALARELNVSFATINRWENAKTRPNRMAQDVFSNYCGKHGICFDESAEKDRTLTEISDMNDISGLSDMHDMKYSPENSEADK